MNTFLFSYKGYNAAVAAAPGGPEERSPRTQMF